MSTRTVGLRITLFAATLLAAQTFAQTEDVSGVGASLNPRVMVIVDNSRSMQATPADDYDVSYKNDKLTTGIMTDTGGGNYVCTPTDPTVQANCRNKFCVGQCVLHNVFDPFDGILEFGFATYYQYYRRVSSLVTSGTGSSTTCYYDVLAGPNEDTTSASYTEYTANYNSFWSKELNLGTAGNCTWTNRTTAPAYNSVTGAAYNAGSGSGYTAKPYSTRETSCTPTATPANAEPAKTCTMISASASWLTDPAYPSSEGTFQHARYSNQTAAGVNMYSGTAHGYIERKCSGDNGGTCTNTVATGTYNLATPTPVSSYVFSTGINWNGSAYPQGTSASVSDGKTWYLYQISRYPDNTVAGVNMDLFRTQMAASQVCPAVGTVVMFNPTATTTPAPNGAGTTINDPGGTNRWSRCTATNPCKMTMVDTVAATAPTQVFYRDWGVTGPTGYTTYTRTSGPTASGTFNTTHNSLTPISCPAQTNVGGGVYSNGCSASPLTCDLAAGTPVTTGNTDTSKFSYAGTGPFTSGGRTYSATGATSTLTVFGDQFDSVTFPAGFPTNGRPGSDPAAACPASITTTTTSAGLACNTANNLAGNCVLTLNVAASQVSPSEPKYVRCAYTRTTRNLSASWNTYNCQYNRNQWVYTGPVPPPLCRWQVTQYDWRVQAARYKWATAGGESIQQFSFTASTTANLCSGVGGAQPAACPTVIRPGDPLSLTYTSCNKPGRECRLRWHNYDYFAGANGTTGGTLSPTAPLTTNAKGRRMNAVTGAASVSNDLYCRMADYSNTPVNSESGSFTQTNMMDQWCNGVTGTASDIRSDDLIMSDPFSPDINQANTGITTGSTYVRGGTVQSPVQYSVDRVNWVNNPLSGLLATKSAGWSRLPNGTAVMAYNDSTVPMFRGFGSGTSLLQLRSSILNLSMPAAPVPAYASTSTASCKNGIQDGTETDVDCGGGCAACSYVIATGHNTPLYGSLSNLRDYLASEITDVTAQCRTYAVVLLTDGLENQPPNQPQTGQGNVSYHDYNTDPTNNLVSIVTAIKNTQINTGTTTVNPIGGIKTYVVGFGNAASGASLDNMAAAAGTGTAYNAQNPTTLANQLQLIFNNIASSRYTRSKPVLTRDGSARTLYAASFDILSNNREWLGYLDAYDTTTIGPTGSPPKDWSFNTQLNGASAGARRYFTWLNNDPARKVNLNGALSGADQTQLVLDMSVADWTTASSVVNFVLNPSKNAPFTGTPVANKSSRLSDIYHSAPAVIGPPSADNTWPNVTAENTAYAAYKAANTTRPSRLFIGSNTGMVHAICEKTGANPVNCGSAGTNQRGVEVYSFAPPDILPNLKYTPGGHTFTADGSFGGADLCTAADCTVAGNWKTVLVGSLYRGGRSLFAVDVTNPDSPNYMFKLTDSTLGESWSAPVVGRANVSVSSGPTNRWLAVAGGGYMTPTFGPPAGSVSNAYLVFDLHTGAIAQDNNGTVALRPARFRVDTNPVSCDSAAPAPSTCLPRNSVPARAAVVRDGKTATMKTSFFGDTQGRMWVSSMTSPVVVDWKPNLLFDPTLSTCSTDVYGTANAPIYDATDIASAPTAVANLPFVGASTPRPIFQRVTLSVNSEGRVTVFAGTGDVLNPLTAGTNASDPTQYNYFYAVRYNDGVAGACYGSPSWIRRFRHNEKMLSESVVGGSVVFAATFMPPSGSDICASRGDGRIYAFYAETGIPAPVFDDLTDPSNPGARSAVLDIPNSGIISDLYFMPDSANRNRGTVGFVDSAGKPAQRGITGIATGAKVKSFKRVR
ncbi:MAG: hypothetical protein K1X64_14180 [Myxococcaceae bacterium]|nr:hypothetical protein [Myxococcaceae bacterium]